MPLALRLLPESRLMIKAARELSQRGSGHRVHRIFARTDDPEGVLQEYAEAGMVEMIIIREHGVERSITG